MAMDPKEMPPEVEVDLTSDGSLLQQATAQSIRLRVEDLMAVEEAEMSVSIDMSFDRPRDTPPAPPLAHAEASSHSWIEDLGEMARGGMGSIHRVRHKPLRRLAVMKVLEVGKGTDQTRQRRFLEEAQITGQLDHPNIPPVHDLWVAPDGTQRFAMKMVQGHTLSDLLRARPPARRRDRDWEQLLDILLKACDAVAFAHSRGVVHRDLKPDNIMVGSHGQVWVMDWGLAALLPAKVGVEGSVTVSRDIIAEPLDGPDTILGTPSYMAPEQALGRIAMVDERTDVYLLGATLYAMLTSRPPHVGKNLADSVRRGQRGEVDDIPPAAVPPELCRIARKALQTSREERYASVDQLRDDLTQARRRGLWFRSETFPEGTLVVRQGDPADSAYTIIKGSCEVFRSDGGQRIVLRRLGPGDTFGETAIFTRQPRTASVEVVEGEMTATVVSREAFERALGDSLLRPFVRALADRFRELDERAVQQLVSESVDL